MRKFTSLITILACILFSSSCFAYVFEPVPGDKSLEYLGTIFQFGNITGSSPTWLRGLFQKFNTLVLSLGVILLSYIYIVSTINTAQEGTFMGKKYASVWIILRSVLGTALLVPTTVTGYSLIQHSIIWVVTNGVGAADNLWEHVVYHLGTGTGKIKIEETKIINSDVSKDLVASLLRTAVCIESCKQYVQNVQLGETLYHKQSFFDETKNTATYAGWVNFGIRGSDGLNNLCGSYRISGEVKSDNRSIARSHAQMLYNSKLEALTYMYSELSAIARLIVAEVVIPRKDVTKNSRGRLFTKAELDAQGQEYDTFTPVGYINKANKIYSNLLSNAIIPQKNVDIRQIQHSAIARGWAAAGEYYYLLNQSSEQELWPDAYKPPTAIQGTVPSFDNLTNVELSSINISFVPNIDKLREFFGKNDDGLIKTLYNLYDAKQYFDVDLQWKTKTINVYEGSNLLKEIQVLQNDEKVGDYIKPFAEEINKIQTLFKTNRNEDPLILLATIGDSIMAEIENSWKKILTDIIDSIKKEEQQDKEIPEMTITVIVTAILMTVWGFAAALAVYLPAVPYIIFALGVMGWMLLVVEAVIAAPILAIGFIMPSQEELGKTMPGLMLLLNILLRPALMVIGFVISSLFLKAVLMFINNGMMEAMYSFRAATKSMTGPVIMLFVYVSLVVVITNRSFALIYILPDKVLRWVGGTGEDTGQTISQVMGEAKGSFEKGSSTFGEFTKGITEAAGSDGTRVAGQLRKFKDGSGLG